MNEVCAGDDEKMLDSEPRDCAVLISSCDNYSDIWEPFFTLFHKFWPDNPYNIFINSETLGCRNEKVAVTTLKARTVGISWTRRLKEALERVDFEYVIFMLDDFFLYDYVNTARIIECLTYMRLNSDMSAICFTWLGGQMKMEECDFPGIEKCGKMGNGKINLILTLWRKSVFLYYLNHDETPWEFEANALERSLSRDDNFYSFSRNAPNAIPYAFMKYGLFAGKWFRSTVDLFKEHGIVFDFSARGFYEEYEFGLIPYVARKIKMDSYLVPCYSLIRDNPRINTNKTVEEGYFSQIYDVSGARDAAIWYPSSYGYHGFAIENFKCIITFKHGKAKVLRAGDVFGSFALYCGTMYFLRPGMFVYILTDKRHEMLNITIKGYMNKHLNRDKLAIAYGMNLNAVPTSLEGLLSRSRIHTETLLVPENFSHFRFCSKLCFKYNTEYNEDKAILDGKDRFPGPFLQLYKINKAANPVVRWDIGGSDVGFAIGDLRVEMLYIDNTSQYLESKNIKGDGVLMEGYWAFFAPSAYLLLSLPENRPDEIRISGNVLAPMPRKVLRAVVFGNEEEMRGNNGGNRLLSQNELRLMLFTIKRAVKKYGVIGIIREAIRRILVK